MEIGSFLLVLIAIFASAKIFGELAERIGQPAVLGELLGGVVVGVSGLRIVDPSNDTVRLLAELGVILLLFLIGLETDVSDLLEVGGSSAAVAVAGVILPFVFGFALGESFGYPKLVSVFLGASLTATSVGITSRVFSDLGYMQTREARVILGAAVIDDVIGLVILTVVGSLAAGKEMRLLAVLKIATIAFGFVVLAIVLGRAAAPLLVRLVARLRVAKALFFASVMFAFALAYLAAVIGSAVVVGAFAAGIVLAKTEHGPQIQREVHDISQFFIPIFFVSVGAAVDLRSLATRSTLILGLLLTLLAVVGKVMAGFVVFDRRLRRIVVGVGMIPRGEVGVIFAQIGLASGLLDRGLYSAVALMVILTSSMTPLLLRLIMPRFGTSRSVAGVAREITGAPADDDGAAASPPLPDV
jgi:Kef-type K+ transport system membrane component KefB